MRKLLSIFLGLMLITAFAFAGSKFNQNFTEPTFSPRTTVSKTASYTATATDDYIKAQATTTVITITLPAISSLASSGLSSKGYKIEKNDTSPNLVTIATNGSDTIDGETHYVLTKYGDYVVISSESSGNWRVDYASNMINVDVTTGVVNAGGNIRTFASSTVEGTVPNVINQASTQTSVATTTVTDITNTSVVLPAGFFDSGETIEWTVVGNITGTNDVKAFRLYVLNGEIVTITTSASSITGDYELNCRLHATGSATQDGVCKLSIDGTTSTLDFATGAKDLSSGGTVKLQIINAHSSDTVTAEYTKIEFSD